MMDSSQSRNALPYALLALTMLFWAGNAVVARAMHDALPPLAMAFWRWTLALLLALPFALRSLRANWPAVRRSWRALLLAGFLGIACYNTLLYAALQTTTATNGLLITAAAPVFIVIVSRIGFGVRMTGWQSLGVVLSIAGILLIVSQGEPRNLLALRLNRGDLYLLTAAGCWALYTTSLRWRPAEIDAWAFFSVTVAIGVLLLAPFYAWETIIRPVPAWTSEVFATIAYIAVFPALLAYLFWNRGVSEIGPNRAGYFIYLIPVFGIALAVVFLGETLFAFHAAGVALIFAGIYLASVRAASATSPCD